MNAKKVFFLTLILSIYLCVPCFAEFKWDLGGALNQAYDDNITYVKNDKSSDAITRVSLGGGFSGKGKNESIDFKGIITQNIYAQHSSFNNLSEELSLNLNKDFGPYQNFKILENFRHAEEPRSFEDSFGRDSGRYSIYTNNLGFEYARLITQQWEVIWKYYQVDTYFTRQDLNDSTQYSPGVTNEYTIDSKNKFLMDYTYLRQEFDGGANADLHNISLGLRHFLTNQFYLDVKPGVNFISAYNNERFVKPRYELGLTQEVDEITKINLKYIREYASTAFTQDIFNSWKVVLSYLKDLTDKLALNTALFYGRGQYKLTGINDKLSGANLGVQYQLTKKVNLYTNYVFEQTDSNFTSRDYVRNMIQVGIKFIF